MRMKRKKNLDERIEASSDYLITMKNDSLDFQDAIKENHLLDFKEIFKKYAKSIELIKSKTVNMGSMYELIYKIELQDLQQQKEFVDDIRCKNGNLKVVLEKIPQENIEL